MSGTRGGCLPGSLSISKNGRTHLSRDRVVMQNKSNVGKKKTTLVFTMIKLTDAVDKADAHANRHKFHLPSSADAAECAKARAELLEHVRSALEGVKNPGAKSNQRECFDALTYYLTWKDLREAH